MRDEVRGVAVVVLVRDVLADVVQQRRVLEELAVVVAQVVQLAGLVEQLEAQLRDVAGVRFGPREAAGSAWIDARRIARGSSVRSTGSWRPIASSTMPSRSAHSLIVSSSTSKSSIAVSRNSAPATMSSTRFVSRPLIFCRCADVDASSSWCSGSNSSREKRQLVQRAGDRLVAPGGDHLRQVLERAAAADRHLRLEALHVDRERAEHVDQVLAQPAPVALRDRVRARRTARSRRATPSRSLAAHCRPVESPTMISTLPPPRSKHSAGPGSISTAVRIAVKISRASSSPSITSAATPASASMRSSTASPLRRAAQRARGAGEDLGRAGGFGEHAEPADGRDGGIGGVGGDEPFAAHDVAEPQHLLLADERLERAVGAHFGDDEVEGVGAEVDRGDAHVKLAYAPRHPGWTRAPNRRNGAHHAENHRRRARASRSSGRWSARRTSTAGRPPEQLAVIGALAAGLLRDRRRPGDDRAARPGGDRGRVRATRPQRRRMRELLVLVELCRHPVTATQVGAGRGVLRRAGRVRVRA